jgi:hypothetical protein
MEPDATILFQSVPEFPSREGGVYASYPATGILLMA